MKNPTTLLLEVNRGIRTVLAWYRDYARGKKKQQVLKVATAAQEAVLEAVSKDLILKNGPSEVTDGVNLITWC